MLDKPCFFRLGQQLFLIIPALVLMVFACGRDEQNTSSQVISDSNIIAIINNRPISRQAVERELDNLVMRFEGMVEDEKLEDLRELLRENALQNLIDSTLILDASEKTALTVDNSEVDERINQFKRMFTTQENFAQQLEGMATTESELREEIRISLLKERFLDDVVLNDLKSVSDADIEAYFQVHKSSYIEPEKVRASHILLRITEQTTPEERQRKENLLAKIRAEILAGASFSEMAVQYSECASRENKGDLGYFSANEMVEGFSSVAFALNPGETSDIVETSFGLHLIHVTERSPEESKSFQDIKEKVRKDYEARKSDELIQNFLHTLKQKADIRIFNGSDNQQMQ